MEAIHPFPDLKTKQREVRDTALKDVVRVTENGKGALRSALKRLAWTFPQ